MANIQRQFLDFDTKIRLKRYSENETLRDKRDKVLNKLRDNFKNNFSEEEIIPTYKKFDQGSYKMGTGVKPIDGDFDIDVGLIFDISKDNYSAFQVKEWVRNALFGHTQGVLHLKPCVRVQYQMDQEPIYHVDLAVYALDSSNEDSKMYLARGTSKTNSEWEEADPKGLISCVKDIFSGEDEKQFKRVVRFLKRWKDNRFSSVNGKPTGIALTLCAFEWFKPFMNTVDMQYNDAKALMYLVSDIVNQFYKVWNASTGQFGDKIEVYKRVAPFDNVFSKMTITQMTLLKEKLVSLRNELSDANNEVDIHEACKKVRKALGGDTDFDVPEKEETARKTSPPILNSAMSA